MKYVTHYKTENGETRKAEDIEAENPGAKPAGKDGAPEKKPGGEPKTDKPEQTAKQGA